MVTHNLNSNIDYVLRLDNIERIITYDYIENSNQILIYLPKQIFPSDNQELTEFLNNHFLSLTIYSIDNKVYPNNVFTSKEFKNIKYNGSDIRLIHNFHTNSIDSIIRLSITNEFGKVEKSKGFFNNLLMDKISLTYDFPDHTAMFNQNFDNIYDSTLNKYLNSNNDIIIYTSQYSQLIYITANDTENIKWNTINITDKYGNVNEYKTCLITHTLPGIVNFNLREITTNMLFRGYTDFLLNNNQIYLIFTEKYDINATYVLNLYTIHINDNIDVIIN